MQSRQTYCFRQIIVVLFILLRGITEVHGQSLISGYIRDSKTREPLIGANVFIPGTSIGVSTNSSGYYSLRLPIGDTITLVSSYIGYKPVMKKCIQGTAGGFDFQLDKGINLEEITVSAPLLSENRYGMNLTEITVSELRGLPALGGEADLIRTYQLLPGVQGGTEGKAGMFVRGGSGDQNLVLIDGSPLYYINHLGGFISLFDPEAVKNFRLYKGGFPARYGNRLSSVLDVNLKEGDGKTQRTSVTVGLIAGSLSSQGPALKGKGTYFVSLRRVWADLLMRPVSYLAFDGASIGYNFYDLNGKISLQANPENKIILSLYAGDDKLTMNYKDELIGPKVKSQEQNKWGNLLGVARWEHLFSPGVLANTRLSFTKYRFLDKGNYDSKEDDSGYLRIFRSRIRDIALNSDLDIFINNNWQVKTGGGIVSHQFEPGNSKSKDYLGDEAYLEQNFATASHVWEHTTFMENMLSFKYISLNAGVRVVGFHVPNKSFIFLEPRLSSSVPVYKGISIKTSYSKMHQFVHMLENPVAGFITEFWVPSTNSVPPSTSHQYTIGLEKENDDFQAGIEFYQKNMNHLVSFKEGQVFQGNAKDWEQRIETGNGSSKGMEIFLRKKSGKLTGWVSYTLARSDRQFENINFGRKFPYQFDRRHDLSVVASLKLSDLWNFSADWVYGSGYPITLALGKQTVILPGNVTRVFDDRYNYRFSGEYYGSRNGFRMKDYHRLDIGFTRTKVSYGVERIWSFSIYNVYNRQNPYYYFYKERRPWQGDHTTQLYQASFLPFLPSVSYTIRF